MRIRNLAAAVDVFTSNVLLVEGERTVVVDPGANFDVIGPIEDAVGDIDAVVLTHTHPDHVENTEGVTAAFDVEAWGFDSSHPAVDHAIADGETVTLGDHEFEALYTPGHKHDHLCFFASEPGVLFAGDLVFQNGGFGRTDLAKGDREVLIESIERVLDRVEEEITEMHCGHGPSVEQDPAAHIRMALRAARM